MALELRIIAIVVGIAIGVILAFYAATPLLKKHCLLDTKGCTSVEVTAQGGSALTRILPTDYFIWSPGDGRSDIIYDPSIRASCEDNLTAALEVHEDKYSIVCAPSLATLSEIYNSEMPVRGKIFYRPSNVNVDVEDILENLRNRKIIY